MGKCISSFKYKTIILQFENNTNSDLKLEFYHLEQKLGKDKTIKSDILQQNIKISRHTTSIKVYNKNRNGNFLFNQEYFSPFEENDKFEIILNELVL